VSASRSYTVAIRQDGSIWAWGNNISGQLGDGTIASRSTPAQVGTTTTWQSIYAGQSHTLAIRQDGTLWAWGENSYGQLGYPNFFESPRQITWSAVTATSPATAAAEFAVYPTLLAAGQALHYNLPAAGAGAELSLYSLAGHRLHAQYLGAASAGTILLPYLVPGWYVAHLRYPDGRTATARFGVQ
jgi:hypothetical protein